MPIIIDTISTPIAGIIANTIGRIKFVPPFYILSTNIPMFIYTILCE